MKRFTIYLFGLILLQLTAIAQSVQNRNHSGNLPTGYYNNAEGLSCSTLKTALASIISKPNNTFLYSEVIPAHEKTDKRRNDNNTADIVWDIYSDNPSGPESYTFRFDASERCGSYTKEGDCYNREHTFPQSWFNSELPMMSDLHHVFPTDGFVNGLRANFAFGEVSNPSKTTLNGSKLGTGNNFGYTSTVFEPINAYKGDIARAILYMIVRYETLLPQWKSNSNANDILDGTIYPGLDAWHLKTLFKWHIQDPVSDKEKNRNDSIFTILGNRNPFIDRPEWVFQIWSCTGLITNTSVTNTINNSTDRFRIYPNPSTNGNIQINISNNSQVIHYELIDIQGKTIYNSQTNSGQSSISLNFSHLRNGQYIVRFKGKDFMEYKKIILARP
jgi:endonuclease I